MFHFLIYLFLTSGLSTISDDVIIVTSSLTKDMTGKEDSYRAAAIRLDLLLCLTIFKNVLTFPVLINDIELVLFFTFFRGYLNSPS